MKTMNPLPVRSFVSTSLNCCVSSVWPSHHSSLCGPQGSPSTYPSGRSHASINNRMKKHHLQKSPLLSGIFPVFAGNPTYVQLPKSINFSTDVVKPCKPRTPLGGATRHSELPPQSFVLTSATSFPCQKSLKVYQANSCAAYPLGCILDVLIRFCKNCLQVILSKCTHILSMHNSDIPNQGTMPRRRYPLKYGHCAFGVAYIALQTLTSTALVQTPYGSYYLQQA